MPLSNECNLMAGILFLTIPTIQYGGYFLLGVLRGRYDQLALTPFQKSMFRAGHAHAGVLVMLSVLAQIFIDQISLSTASMWTLRAMFPTSALLISGGFFFSAMSKGATTPNRFIILIYVGIATLAVSLIWLGLKLICC